MHILMTRAAKTVLCFTLVYFELFSGSHATEAPSFIEEPSDVIVQKNRPTQLNCSVKGDPRPRIEWRRNNVPLILSNDGRRKILPDGSLYFSQIVHVKGNKPDEGQYQCIAQSRINNLEYVLLSRMATLQVAGLSSKITVEVLPQPARVMQGDVARFLCVVRHAVPTPVIEWRRVIGSSSVLKSNKKYWILPNGVLQIHGVQHPVDTGEYECIVTNPVSLRQHTSSPVRLDTLPDSGFPRKIKFVVGPVPTNATQGERVVLECVANASPPPAITWYKDDVALAMDSRRLLIGGSNLLISDISLSDAGSYKCKATSQGREEESAAASLQVQYPPKFKTWPRTSHAYVDADARFECAADGIPKAIITWRKNGAIQQSGHFVVIGDGYLIVKALVQPDMGVYQCFASNALGNIQAAAELLVYRKGVPIPQQPTSTASAMLPTTKPTPQPQFPGPPLNVAGHALSDTEIEVRWSPPVDPHGVVISYNVFHSVKDGPGDHVTLLNTSGNRLSIRISNLQPNTKYKIHVYAQNEHGTGAISAEAVVKTAASNAQPSAPRDVSADAKSESTIRVTWSEPETGANSVARYVVSYSESSQDDFRQVTTREQTVMLRQLQTYTKYDIRVHAENKKGLQSPSTSVQVTTKSGVPLYPPVDFVLVPDNVGTGLIATWKAPNMVNGQITFYVIKFRRVGSSQANKTSDIGAENEQYSLLGLLPDTGYEAKIAAGSAAGQGPFTSSWVRATTKRAKCREDRVPGPPTNVRTNAFEKMIHVTWSPPDDAGRICVRKYIVKWGKLNPYRNNRTLPADKREILLTELTPNQQYIISITAENSAGNGLAALESVQTVGSPPPMPVKILKILPLSPRAMKVSWNDKSSSRSPVYYVFFLKQGKLAYCGNTTSQALNCTGLRPYTEYRFYVRRNNDKVNATGKNRTMEDVPGPPVDLTGSPDETDFSKLQLHWQVPEVTNGPIRGYKIYFSTDKSAPLKEWGSVDVPGSQMVATITSLTKQTKYYFKMRARTKRGWGKLSAVKEIRTPPYPSTPRRPTRYPKVDGESTTAENASAPAAAAARGGGDLGDKTLWIAIAAVAGITLIAIIIISIILCKKRSGEDVQRRPPPTYKSVIQSNGSTKKKTKEEKSPDLWVNQPERAEPAPAVEAPHPPVEVARSASSSEVPLEYMKLNASKTSFHSDIDDDMEPEVFPTTPLTTSETQWGGAGAARDHDRPYPALPATSTPLHDWPAPGGGPPDGAPQAPPSHSPEYQASPAASPIERSPPPTLPKPTSRGPVTPADDIQLPAVGFSRLPAGPKANGVPNGLYTPPPKYDELFAASSPPKDNALVKAELEQELAGLAGLLKDLDTIRSEDFQL